MSGAVFFTEVGDELGKCRCQAAVVSAYHSVLAHGTDMAGSGQGRAGRLQSWALGHREKTSLDLAFDKVGQCIVTLRYFSWARQEVRKTGSQRLERSRRKVGR